MYTTPTVLSKALDEQNAERLYDASHRLIAALLDPAFHAAHADRVNPLVIPDPTLQRVAQAIAGGGEPAHVVAGVREAFAIPGDTRAADRLLIDLLEVSRMPTAGAITAWRELHAALVRRHVEPLAWSLALAINRHEDLEAIGTMADRLAALIRRGREASP